MMRIAARSAVSVSRSTAVQARCLTGFHNGLEFRPVLDPPTDPLDETARSAFEKSCYLRINWKISENANCNEAVKRMVGNKIGALAVTEGDGDQGEVIGIISERDYLSKVAFLGKDPKQTKVSEVCTHGKANLVSVTLDNPIDACMRKLLNHNCRHLLIRQKATGKIVGIMSMKVRSNQITYFMIHKPFSFTHQFIISCLSLHTHKKKKRIFIN